MCSHSCGPPFTFTDRAGFSESTNGCKHTGPCGGTIAATGSFGGDAASPASEATVRLVPTTDYVLPGGYVDVEVYINDVDSLTMYQISLDAYSGSHGRLTITDVWVDADRADYVFEGDFIHAADSQGGRAGAIHLTHAFDVAESAYLATFRLAASGDAAGTFTVDLGDEQANFLFNTNHEELRVRSSDAVEITVAQSKNLGTRRGVRSAR